MYVCINASHMIYAIFVLWDEILILLNWAVYVNAAFTSTIILLPF